jgi:hypothetical protein
MFALVSASLVAGERVVVVSAVLVEVVAPLVVELVSTFAIVVELVSPAAAVLLELVELLALGCQSQHF